MNIHPGKEPRKFDWNSSRRFSGQESFIIVSLPQHPIGSVSGKTLHVGLSHLLFQAQSMLAAFGNIKVVKILIDAGGNFDSRDILQNWAWSKKTIVLSREDGTELHPPLGVV